MKRKRTAESGLLTTRLLLYSVAVGLMITGTLPAFFHSEAPTNTAQRTLTFAERVAYQRAIEEVYWRHRIWPKERPDPKPSLDTVMSQGQLEKKVSDYLRNSQALEDSWYRAINAEQLQAEIDRMAQHTKQPEVLRELFAALGNDPFVIAECLARPALAERLTADLSAQGKIPRFESAARIQGLPSMPIATALRNSAYTLPRIFGGDPACTDNTWIATTISQAPAAREYQTVVWTGSEMIIWGGEDISGGLTNTGGRYNPSTDSWTATSTINAPTARQSHTAIWTGSEMIVWGGNQFGSPPYFYTGGRYNPGTDSWTATSTNNAPAARNGHTAVWTGSEMIVWGGNDDNGRFNTGGRYNPNTDNWTSTTTTNAPVGRTLPTAVWTGSKMIVWGGGDFIGTFFNTGGIYDPSTNSWTATSTTNAPAGRFYHTAVWTGSEMIVWGGWGGGANFNTGGRYNPTSDTWTATNITDIAAARIYHTAVWTGSEMIIWGGSGSGGDLNTGARYDPRSDGWTATTSTNAPAGRSFHTAVWTGSQMIVWGGSNNGTNLNTGGRYCAAAPTPTPTPTASPTPTSTATPSTCIDAWAATSTTNAPSARSTHTAVWTGSEMIVWGGWNGQPTLLNTGGRYTPSTDSWTDTSIANAPSGRLNHTAVWTGSEMIVWGGTDANGSSNTGGRYNPSMDSWVATTTTNAPAGRYSHTAVWSGIEMIVWGGHSGGNDFGNGGRYNPTTDSWTATSIADAPSARSTHTAVWTGSEMIVWGGANDSGYLNSGGRYNPGTDSWVATSTTNEPTARNGHTAVWTGNEMIVWGGDNNIPPYYLTTGGRYNPSANSWVATSTANTPSAREFHTAIWAAGDMIVWGGISNGSYVNTGGRYSPATDTWTATSITYAPSARSNHTAVWTSGEMIVWGGSYFDGQNNQYLNTGGKYCGQYPTPTPTPTSTPMFWVTNTNDSGPGSLRQALADAVDGDTINFAVTGTIGLTSGELLVDHSITISGPGAENLAINGNAKSRVFHIASGQTVTISGLTITNGHASDSGGGIYNDHAVLMLSNCTITANSVPGNIGGAIHNDGENIGRATLQINNSLITNNSGGIYNDALQAGAATLVITYSALSNNGPGEAINNDGWSCTFCGNGTTSVQITNSSITNNPGGAIYSDTGRQNCGGSCPTTISITNSTINRNGGGITNSTLSDTAVSNSTISDNGSGIYNDGGSYGTSVVNSTMSNNGMELRNDGPATLFIGDTIFNVSPSGHSIVSNFGPVNSFGYNISSDDGNGYLNSPGDQINTDPLLGPLQDNGGPTFTHALLPGSPAINAGDPNFVGPPDYDQRGPNYYRVRGGRIDVGSFEVQNPPSPSPTPRIAPTPRPRPTPPPRP